MRFFLCQNSVCKLFAWILLLNFSNFSQVYSVELYQSPYYPISNLKLGYVAMFDRNSDQIVFEKIPASASLNFLHSNQVGGFLLPLFQSKLAADIYSWWNNRSWSCSKIKEMVLNYAINLEEFVPADGKNYKNFNDFFTRKLSEKGLERREFDLSCNILSAPADSKLFVLPSLNNCDNFWLKESDFDLKTFVGNDSELAEKFDGGLVMIFRLAPHDYHRFHAPVDMKIEKVVKLGKNLESVSPVAYAAHRKPLIKNKRMLIVAYNEQLGDFLMVPVGAMMVGKICLTEKQDLQKGEEVGFFEFGGSTVVCIFQKGAAQPEQILLQHSSTGLESKILTGDSIAKIIKK